MPPSIAQIIAEYEKIRDEIKARAGNVPGISPEQLATFIEDHLAQPATVRGWVEALKADVTEALTTGKSKIASNPTATA